ncbi:GrxA family glutaredoxin [Marinobacter lutaoensis]|jgi:glutaredoxin 1|uniref:GrxA family glutaredoxin n=1 Tax=Marinobacter lutaoensis TaxID=135739 RepID=A0A1V2DQ14_9GAMM|nr:GrxA family glutaredoxin [Marinobacter lutaoensis]MBE01609.1 GrxA family glutaredoxin [Marinobacter sp.]MBI44158.1 GrxA family glutaredoxin [Oceanospirillales bacterium]NVD35236.1 GrxA family glutaredoxin [Marinobacter lutaoensis]ONF42734.1 GrxA family glutaredoxin [Marinobacter lutaoensis]|tara:strand:- start:53 stop:307 length:255 start_codon:yes stop_codon:yes gene_type:complete
MEQVTIYGRSSCGFCIMAKQLCERLQLPYTWVDMVERGISKADLAAQIGKPVYTVPQIFVGSRHIGGYDDFSAFVRENLSEAAR